MNLDLDAFIPEFRGIDDGGHRWLVSFALTDGHSDWLTAAIPVAKSIPDDCIVPFAKHIFHIIARAAGRRSSDWKVHDDVLEDWEAEQAA